MNPPLRSTADKQALLAGLKSGLIDAIATDHAPHDIASKQKPLEEATFGIVGVETLLCLSLDLYHQGLLTLPNVLAKLTCNPAKIINSDRGIIAKNAIADLVLIDLNHQWQIDPDKFYSKSKNSPFGGLTTKGKAVLTVVGGTIVFDDRN
jgi:dihydroorotase